MQNLWTALESHTRSWQDLDRQAVADAVWADYVSVRFARTGDKRALQFLYPYLNRAERSQRLHAIEVAGRVFEGRGRAAIEELAYFTRNTDPFLRDRAVWPIAAAMAGSAPEEVVQVMEPYLSNRNHFVQRQAAEALGKAAEGMASEMILDRLEELAARLKMDERVIRWSIARIFRGKPSERSYRRIADVSAPAVWRGTDEALGAFLMHAPQEWYLRACKEFFAPRLANEEGRFPFFLHRCVIDGLCAAGKGRGMHPLETMFARRGNRCTGYAMYKGAEHCFTGADVQANRDALIHLLDTTDVPGIRIVAVCLGRLLRASEDPPAIEKLSALMGSRNGSVRSAALAGLGQVAKGTCDTGLKQLCLKQARDGETATAAVRALGLLFAGSGQSDVFAEIRQLADHYRSLDPGARHHSRPLLACYAAVGDLYAGTGSSEPLDFLLQVLAPSPVAWCPFRWVAGGALVKIEFPQQAVTRVLGDEF